MKLKINVGPVAAVLLVFVTLTLLLCHMPYLLRAEGQSIFLPHTAYFSYCMELPGGLLTWLSTFLTQMFYLPWLGALVYTLLGLGLMWLVCRAFAVKGYSAATAVVPSAMALLSFMGLGYLIFSLKSPGLAYMPLLGFAVVASVFWGYRALSCKWGRLVLLPLIVCILYWCAGAYALFAVILCMVYELRHINASRLMPILTVVVGLISVVTWPYVWYWLIGGRLQHTDIYTAALPRLHAGEFVHWLPYIATALYMLVMALLADSKAGPSRKGRWVSMALGVGALVWAIAGCNHDPNFYAMLKMQAAVDDQQWQQVLDVASEATDTPTRLNSMLTEIALMHMGQATERMYAYPYGDAEYQTTRADRALHDAGAALICYHWGLPNYAYRWATEMMVEYGIKVDYLKLLAKSALLNGDYALARKYLTTLSQTMWHRPWAERYMAYADDPSLIVKDQEMSRLMQLKPVTDRLGVDDGAFEITLRPEIATSTPGNAVAAEFAMQSALVAKDLNSFMHWLPQYMQGRERMPRHFQEALMIWCYVNDSDLYTRANIDQSVLSRFDQFVNAYQRCQRLSAAEQAANMRPSFGDTYWFYFIILDNMQFI